MKKMCIVALGWLGEALYDKAQSHYSVVGTYFSRPKGKANEFSFDITNPDIPDQIQNSDIVFFNLPPRSFKDFEIFKNFYDALAEKKFVFISSTSVYGQSGEVDEEKLPKPISNSGKLLRECENHLIKKNKDYYIIRPAGLYGGNRHPGKFLSGRENLQNPHHGVNLISQEDLIRLILKLLAQNEIRILNAVNSHHPLKKDYYTDFCQRHELALPKFNSIKSEEGKIVVTKHLDFIINSKLA